MGNPTKLLVLLLLTFLAFDGMTQVSVAINTDGSAPDESAILDVKSSNQGFLVPRLDIPNLGGSDPVTNPAAGLMVYNTSLITGPGMVIWSGSGWETITTVSSPQGVFTGEYDGLTFESGESNSANADQQQIMRMIRKTLEEHEKKIAALQKENTKLRTMLKEQK